MWANVLHRLCGLVVIVAYAVATIVAAASPVAACPGLDHAHHVGQQDGADHTDHHHHDGSRSHPGDCLKCCMGTCLLGVSLHPPVNGASSIAFYGTPVVYASEQSLLADRSIAPDLDPPKPIA
jgi:hypothetical protein